MRAHLAAIIAPPHPPVRALVTGATARSATRSRERAVPAGAEAVRGRRDRSGLDGRAAAGCELVFNAHGLPEQWFADPGVFDRVNARGAEAVVRAARDCRRPAGGPHEHDRRLPRRVGRALDESTLADYPKGTAYERSKQRAEQLVLASRTDPGSRW